MSKSTFEPSCFLWGRKWKHSKRLKWNSILENLKFFCGIWKCSIPLSTSSLMLKFVHFEKTSFPNIPWEYSLAKDVPGKIRQCYFPSQYYVTTNKLTGGNSIVILQWNYLRKPSASWYSEEHLLYPTNLVEEELPTGDFCKQKEVLIEFTIKEITH